MRKIGTEKLFTIIILLLIFGISQLSIGRLYGFSLYPDEFGYWASAAPFAGYDWSVLASLGSYYSFGYSLILAPVLLLFRGGVVAYRVAVMINFILLALGFLLIRKLSRMLYGSKDADISGILICAAASFYPPWVLYSQMTMAESVLIFVFVLLCFVFAKFVQKPGPVNGILLVITAIYLYSVHMRSVGVLLALACTYVLLLLADKKSRKYALILGGVAVLALVAFFILKLGVVRKIFTYASAEALDVNGYGSQTWKIRDIFTLRGFGDFLTELLGKVYYLVIATGSLALFAAFSGIRSLSGALKSLKCGRRAETGDYVRIFLFLGAVAQILISAVYMHGSDRADILFYGRYEEFLSPLLILTGAFEVRRLFREKKWYRVVFAGTAAIYLLFALIPLFFRFFGSHTLGPMRGFFVSGIGYLFRETDGDPYILTCRASVAGLLLILLTLGILGLSEHLRRVPAIMGLLVALSVILGVRLGEQYSFKINGYLRSTGEILSAMKEHPEREIYYIDDGDAHYIDYFQFQLPEHRIRLVGEEDVLSGATEGGYLVVYRNHPVLDRITEYKGSYTDSTLFRVFGE